MTRFFHAAVLALATALVAPSTTNAYRPVDAICTYATSRSSCSLSTLSPSKTDGSVLVYPGGKTRCAFDSFKDDKTGFTTNATYFFQVFPKRQRNKLALILEGGGACIDKQTCNFALQCSLPSQLIDTTAEASSTGVLNATDPSNVFKDWNIVYVPYCTGDLHVGNAVLDPFESGIEAAFRRPQCLGLQKKTHLNGLNNVKAAFQWAKANYPYLDELVLGGMSAGSLGVQALASYTADLFDVKADGIQYGVLADSYVGVLPSNTTAGKVLNFYGGCSSELRLPASTLTKCQAETMSITDLTTAQLKQLPRSAWLFLNSMGDATQRLFYQLAKDGITAFPFTNRISADEFFAEASKILDTYKAVSQRVATFIVDGSQHIFLNLPTYYNTVSTTGQTLDSVLTEWLASLTW